MKCIEFSVRSLNEFISQKPIGFCRMVRPDPMPTVPLSDLFTWVIIVVVLRTKPTHKLNFEIVQQYEFDEAFQLLVPQP